MREQLSLVYLTELLASVCKILNVGWHSWGITAGYLLVAAQYLHGTYTVHHHVRHAGSGYRVEGEETTRWFGFPTISTISTMMQLK